MTDEELTNLIESARVMPCTVCPASGMISISRGIRCEHCNGTGKVPTIAFMTLLAELRATREALRPFARVADVIDALPPNRRPSNDAPMWQEMPRAWPSMGECRSAAMRLGMLKGADDV